jgi:cytochrome c oxidase assembly protein subunit 15
MGGATLALSVLAAASVLLVLTGAGGRDRLFGHAASGFGGAAVVCLLAWLARTREPRRWVRWGTIALLGAIIIQGVLGGLRVTEVNLELAMVHGVFAQVTFCLAGSLILATSHWWTAVDAEPQVRYAGGSRPWLAPAVLTSLVFAQLLIAVVMRHYQAGLAVPDFPLSYGQVMPPVSQAGLDRANEVRAFDLSLPPTSLGQIWLHSAHRIGALVITVAYCWLLRQVVRWPREMRPARHVMLLSLALAAQISLGVATVWMGKPADVATAHVATGALLLLASWLLVVRLLRVSRRSDSHQSLPAGGALTEFRNPWRRRPRQTARPGALVPTSA